MIKRYLGEQKVEGEMDLGPEWGPECLGAPSTARTIDGADRIKRLHLIQCDDCDHIQYDKRQDTPNKRSMSCGKCAGNRLAYVHRAGPYNAGSPQLRGKHQFLNSKRQESAVVAADLLYDKVARPPANARTYPIPTFPGGGALYHMQCQECGLIYADLGEKDPACICGVVGELNFTWWGGPLPFVCEGSLAQDRANSLAIS